ncbi:MAG TPA: Ig-like domain repeat protein [Gemmataceae bacterium]|nr:Ig-like domain repeat protein [Gemmataceae bacterium]
MFRIWFCPPIPRLVKRIQRSRHSLSLAWSSGQLRLEALESRLAPATHTWTGATSNLWSAGTNWSGGSPAGDPTAVLIFPGGAANLTNSNDLTGLSVTSITFSGNSNYSVGGNALTLNSGGITLDSTVTSATDTITFDLTLGLSQAWTVTTANTALAVSGMISSGAGAGLTKTGAGILALGGTNGAFQGGVTLSAGTLSLGTDTALGTATATLSGGVLGASTAVSLTNLFTVSASTTIGGSNNITFMGPITLTSGATLTVNNSATTTFAAALGGSGSLDVAPGLGGTVALSVANNTFTGSTTLTSGTLSLGNSTSLGSGGTLSFLGGTLLTSAAAGIAVANPINVNAAANAATIIGGSNNISLTGPVSLLNATTPLTVSDTGGATFNSSVTGAGGLTITAGTGTVLLLVANTYMGTTTLTSGVLVVGDPSALGTGNLVLGGGKLQSNGTVTLSNSFTVTGPATVGGSNTLTLSGPGILNTGSMLTVDNTAATTLSGVLSGGGGLADVGTGTLILSAVNMYTGPTLISTGTLQLGVANAVPSGSAVTADATFDLHNLNDTIGSLAGMGTVFLGSGTLTTGGTTPSTTFTGQINGTGGLTKIGTGTLTLTGTNGYTGATDVMAGTLIVNGSQPGSNITVSNVASLGGSGTVGTLTVTGTVSPGGPGTAILHSGNTAFNPGSTFVVTLNGTTAGTGYSQLNASGNVDLTTNPTLNLTAGFAANIGDTFTIITSMGTLTGTFAGLPNNSTIVANGQTFRITYSGTAVTLARTVSATTTVVTASANPSVFGQPVTFTATVSPVPPITGTPTGMVTFQDGSTVLGMGTLTNGVATFTTTTPLSIGPHMITAVYNGDASFAGSTSPVLSQIVNQASTTVTVSGSPSPSATGQSVTFTATVMVNTPGTGTPTGTVTFRDGVTILGSGMLDSTGHAMFSTTSLATGMHTITAVYSGDTNFTTTTSQPFTQNVLLPTVSTLASSPNPSIFGQSVTFTVTVAPVGSNMSTPTGTVTFKDGTNTIGTAMLSGGTATFTTSTLTTGFHTISASYGGDSTFASSTSGNVSQTVNQATTSTTLMSSVNPSASGQLVIFTATVTAVAPGSGIPTGTVTFRDGTTTLSMATLDANGRATFQVSSLTPGPHTITATYGGDTNFTTSASTALTQTVQSSSTVALTSSVNPSVFGQPVVLTATVSAVSPATGTPTGMVTFMDGTTTLGTGTLNASGVATFTSSGLSVGSHTITAMYGGDSTFSSSTSTGLTQMVNPARTTTVVTSSLNPSTSGQAITFTATVSPTAPGAGTPTGSVTFMDGSTVLGTGTLSGGSATFQTSSLSVAAHQITAVYGGDSNFSGSTSAALTQTVNQAAPTGTPSQKFVTQVYRDLLGRDPDPGGLAHFSSLIDMNQATNAQVAEKIQTSQEARTRQVQNLFQQFLGRQADPVGLDLSTRFLGMGGSFFQLESAIVGSPEYFQRAGGTNNGFLTAVYRDALNRAVDPVGQSLGSQALASGTSMAHLAEVVFTSQEGLQDQVQSFFNQFLHRAADSAALGASTTALQQRIQQQEQQTNLTQDQQEEQAEHGPPAPVGASVDDLVGVILGSTEYSSRL